jgi:IS5 family transposase
MVIFACAFRPTFPRRATVAAMSPKATAEATRARTIPEDDPAWQAAINAPVVHSDSEYECDEEREQVEEARRTGRFIPGEQVSAEIAARRDAEE